MATASAKKLAQSNHTLADIKRFAREKPADATKYLGELEKNLRDAGNKRAADAVKKVLTDKTGTLVERINEHKERLNVVFPSSTKDWAKTQAKRAPSVGYNEMPVKVAPQFITGKVRIVDGVAHFRTTSGRDFTLNNPAANQSTLPMNWMQGMLGDGNMTLMGLVGEDNKSFNVEGFALNEDGAFDTFTFGRVSQDDPPIINTTRGPVEIANRDLLAKLKAMPRLGIILPGEPEKRANGKLVYTGNPEEMFGLARWREQTTTGSGNTRTALADMAYSIFANKPVEIPANQADRVNHGGRLWVRGMVELGADGTAVNFKATYTSKQCDSYGNLNLGASTLEADSVQGVVMSTDPSELPEGTV